MSDTYMLIFSTLHYVCTPQICKHFMILNSDRDALRRIGEQIQERFFYRNARDKDGFRIYTREPSWLHESIFIDYYIASVGNDLDVADFQCVETNKFLTSKQFFIDFLINEKHIHDFVRKKNEEVKDEHVE